MGENCPFMALQRVHEKSRSAPEMKLTCPVSGFHSAKLTTEFAATSHISSKAEQEPSTAFDSPKFVRNFCLGSIQEHADGEDESESTFPGKGCSLRNPASYETSDSDSKEQQKESHLQSQASFSTEKFPKLGYSGTARSNSHAGSFAGIEVMMKGSRLYRSKSFSPKMFNGFIAFVFRRGSSDELTERKSLDESRRPVHSIIDHSQNFGPSYVSICRQSRVSAARRKLLPRKLHENLRTSPPTHNAAMVR